MVTLTHQEFEELTPEERKAHLAAEEKIVFGHDVQHRNGKPVEQGIGAPGHEGENHFAHIRRFEGPEAEAAARAAAAKHRRAAS